MSELNKEMERCLKCYYLVTKKDGWLSISFDCTMKQDMYNCEKFISKEEYNKHYNRRKKLNKINEIR